MQQEFGGDLSVFVLKLLSEISTLPWLAVISLVKVIQLFQIVTLSLVAHVIKGLRCLYR